MFTEEKVINYTWNYFRWRQETYIHQNEMNNKTQKLKKIEMKTILLFWEISVYKLLTKITRKGETETTNYNYKKWKVIYQWMFYRTQKCERKNIPCPHIQKTAEDLGGSSVQIQGPQFRSLVLTYKAGCGAMQL